MLKILWILFFIAWTISFVLWIVAMRRSIKNNSFIPLSYSLVMSIFAFGMILMCILGN